MRSWFRSLGDLYEWEIDDMVCSLSIPEIDDTAVIESRE
jgi:hypothetical protein